MGYEKGYTDEDNLEGFELYLCKRDSGWVKALKFLYTSNDKVAIVDCEGALLCVCPKENYELIHAALMSYHKTLLEQKKAD